MAIGTKDKSVVWSSHDLVYSLDSIPVQTKLHVAVIPADCWSCSCWWHFSLQLFQPLVKAVPSNPVICWPHMHGTQIVLIRASILQSLMFMSTNRHSSLKIFLCCMLYLKAFVPDHQHLTIISWPTTLTRQPAL